MADVENKFRYQNELFYTMLLFGGSGRAGPRAWSAAQARPAAPCRASPRPMTFGPGRARAGPKWRASGRAHGLGLHAQVYGQHTKKLWLKILFVKNIFSHDFLDQQRRLLHTHVISKD